MTNHFVIDPGEPWRTRLAAVRAPTLVLHGTDDPFLPYGHGVALAAEIPGARLVAMERTGHEAPPTHTWDAIIPAVLEHTSNPGVDQARPRVVQRRPGPVSHP